MTEAVLLTFLIWTVITVTLSSLVVGLFWSVPGATMAWRYWRREGNAPRRIYSYWRLVRTGLALFCLLAFLTISVVSLVVDDPDNIVRQSTNRIVFTLVTIAVSALVISEPVSERRIDAAIRSSGGALSSEEELDRLEAVRHDLKEVRDGVKRVEKEVSGDQATPETLRGAVDDIKDAVVKEVKDGVAEEIRDVVADAVEEGIKEGEDNNDRS